MFTIIVLAATLNQLLRLTEQMNRELIFFIAYNACYGRDIIVGRNPF